MSYEPGISVVSEALQRLSHERRNAIGQASIEIMMQEIFVWGEMQTDPNFGNYLVRINDNEDGIDSIGISKDAEGNDVVNMLEINTTPGMTATSFIPQQVRAAGLDIKDVLSDIVENQF